MRPANEFEQQAAHSPSSDSFPNSVWERTPGNSVSRDSKSRETEFPKPTFPNRVWERESAADEFEQQAAHSPSLVREFWDFLNHTKKWWLLPILVVLLLLALLIMLSGTGAAPFIYTLF
jgi:hypothetical protein